MRRPTADLSALVYGKIPPQAVEAEEGVLGALMLESWCLDEVASIIPGPEAFYTDAHQRIYTAILELRAAGRAVDLLTVTERLRENNQLETVGGAYYITKLTVNVVSSAHTVTHSRIVLERYISRELIGLGSDFVRLGYEGADCFDLLDYAEERVFSLNVFNHQSEPVGAAQAVFEVSNQIELQRMRKTSITGVSTGFAELDACTAGFQKGNFIIIAARPSVGKTALTLNMLENAARDSVHGGAGAYFSLEMTTGELVKRMLARRARIPLKHVLVPSLLTEEEEYRLAAAKIEIARCRIHFDDSPGLTVPQLRTKARRLKAKHDIQILYIDYIQLMKANSTTRGNREQEIAQISRDLKELAKELEIPIVGLSQMSRDIEKGASREPVLADLRESGALEQDADLVGFLWRPNKEDLRQKPHLAGTGTFFIRKHRNGETKDFILAFEGEYQDWHELEPEEFQSMAARIRESEAARIPGGGMTRKGPHIRSFGNNADQGGSWTPDVSGEGAPPSDNPDDLPF